MIVFVPTTNSSPPVTVTVASLLFFVASVVIDSMLYGTDAVYDVVSLSNAGDNVPDDKLNAFNVASLDAFLVTVN